MADEIIRDFGGRIIARIETKPNGTRLFAILAVIYWADTIKQRMLPEISADIFLRAANVWEF